MKAVAIIRVALGMLIVAVGAWRIGEGLNGIISQIDPEPVYGLDGPLPLGFQTYAGQVIAGVLLILGGLAIVKQWWRRLTLVCWFCLVNLLLERVYKLYLDGCTGLRPAIDYVVMLAFVAIILACSFVPTPGDPPAARGRPVATAFTAAAVISLICRAVWFLATPDFTEAIDYLSGATEYPSRNHVTVVNSLISPLLALLLLAAITIWRRCRNVLPITLVIAASFLTGGLLQSLDVLFDSGYAGYRSPDHYVVQEGLSFWFCIAALAAVIPNRRMSRNQPMRMG